MKYIIATAFAALTLTACETPPDKDPNFIAKVQNTALYMCVYRPAAEVIVDAYFKDGGVQDANEVAKKLCDTITAIRAMQQQQEEVK